MQFHFQYFSSVFYSATYQFDDEALVQVTRLLCQHLFDKVVSISRDAHQVFIEVSKNHLKQASKQMNSIAVKFSKRIFKMQIEKRS